MRIAARTELKRGTSPDLTPDAYEALLLQTAACYPKAQHVETRQVVAAGVGEGTGVEPKSANGKPTVARFEPLVDAWATAHG